MLVSPNNPGGVEYPAETLAAFRDLARARGLAPVSYTHLRAHETVLDLVCRLLLENKKKQQKNKKQKAVARNTYSNKDMLIQLSLSR